MELVIVIFIILVLALGVALIIDPVEQVRRSRDTNRASDIDALKGAIDLTLAESVLGGGADVDGGDVDSCSGENAQKVFVSVPSSEAPPSPSDLPTGWTYKQVAAATLYDVDNTGWMPIDLTLGGTVTSPISNLPVDPINTFASGQYYTYVCERSSRDFELTARLNSERFGTGGGQDTQSGDGGDDPYAYEIGNDRTLNPKAPVARWSFNSGLTGSISDGTTQGLEDDQSGDYYGTARNTNATGMQWLSGVDDEAVEFDGVDDYIEVSDPSVDALDGFTKGFTVTFWLNPDTIGSRRGLIRKYDVTGNQRAWFLEEYNSTSIGSFFSSDGTVFETWDWENKLAFGWQHISLTWATATKPEFYRNGISQQRVGTDGNNIAQINSSTASLEIGRGAAGSPFDGEIDEVLVYNRTLTQVEIRNQYEALKP